MSRDLITSPKGVAVWPKLHEPDTKFKTEGEYGVKLAFDPNEPEVAALVDRLETLQQEEYAAFLKEKPANKKFQKAPVFTQEEDEEGEETGRILINFKMKASGVSKKTGKPWTRKPTFFDSRGQKMAYAPKVGGGSILRVAFEASGFGVSSSKLFYLSCRLSAVKVIELVQFGELSAEEAGFGEDEGGFAADTQAPSVDTDEPQDDADDADADF